VNCQTINIIFYFKETMMNTTYGKTLCLLACTSLFAGCINTPACDAQKEEIQRAPEAAPAQIPAEPTNMAAGPAVHHGVVALGSAEQFASVIAHGNVVVDVFATWCGPCKRLAPELEALAAEYGTKVQFIKVDGDQFPSIVSQYHVSGYPTLLFFKDGKLVHTKVGGDSRSGLKTLINSVFGL
jgi:thioredoxin 1